MPGPDGISLEPVPGLVVEWELDALMRAADAGEPGRPAAWMLPDAPDWGALESLRLITAAAGETALAVAVARPVSARDHSGDVIAATMIEPEAAESADEVLLSTEYDPSGAIRRLGIELWLADGSGRRVGAARRDDPVPGVAAGLARVVTPLEVRIAGERGTGLHEHLAAG